jgi:hypothetical protein
LSPIGLNLLLPICTDTTIGFKSYASDSARRRACLAKCLLRWQQGAVEYWSSHLQGKAFGQLLTRGYRTAFPKVDIFLRWTKTCFCWKPHHARTVAVARAWGKIDNFFAKRIDNGSSCIGNPLILLIFLNEVATPAGFEPAAYCLEGSCSILLSYGVLPLKSRV